MASKQLGMEYRKKVKSSTQCFAGPKPLDKKMAVTASATLPKTPPELAAPNGALWSI